MFMKRINAKPQSFYFPAGVAETDEWGDPEVWLFGTHFVNYDGEYLFAAFDEHDGFVDMRLTRQEGPTNINTRGREIYVIQRTGRMQFRRNIEITPDGKIHIRKW